MITPADQPINEQTNFGCFLRTLRQRISPQSATLGSWERLPVRCGRPVSQEEIAEVVGVTRNWYSRLESGEAARTSVRLVDRLARALTSTPEERSTLFHLAIPELG